MAVQTCDVEVWVMVNDQGEYVAHEDNDQLAEAYGERIGELNEAGGIRRVKVKVRVPLPEVIEVEAEAEEEPQTA